MFIFMRVISWLVFLGIEIMLAVSMLKLPASVCLLTAIVMVLSLYLGMGVCRWLLYKIAVRLPRDLIVPLLLLIVVGILPLFPTAYLWFTAESPLRDAVAPDFYTAWHTAAAMTLLHAIIRFLGLPGSVRSVIAYLHGENLDFTTR
ncbi:MAG: hypothetical protein K2W82_15550 [Candidatus Obscuribacterales bacterium]|nr:hypothetical protein [Candidatus Obscuribacterales bacterium]